MLPLLFVLLLLAFVVFCGTGRWRLRHRLLASVGAFLAPPAMSLAILFTMGDQRPQSGHGMVEQSAQTRLEAR